ncbi:class II aldolase/adducin family protein [Jatrophihabitans sp. DSM 45814]
MPVSDIAQLRDDLVTCTRLLVHHGVLDYSGHLSARIPGTDHVLIQPRDQSRAALSAKDLLVVDLDGNLVEGEIPPPAETAIHTGVYRARPDVSLVCHGHPSMSTTFSMTDRPLLPMRHFAYKFPSGLVVHPDTTHIRSREQGDAVAATLGDASACLLRSHGTVVVGTRIDVLFMDCLDIEENARTQLLATQLGGKLLPLTPEEIASIAESYNGLGHRPGKMWEHYVHRGRVAGFL